jgi:hypothetical protein
MVPRPHENGLLFDETGRLRALRRNPKIRRRNGTAIEKLGGRLLAEFAQFPGTHKIKLDRSRPPLAHPQFFLVRVHGK